MSQRHFFMAGSSVLLALATVSVAQAQGFGGRGRVSETQLMTQLVQVEKVQTELELLKDQIADLTKMAEAQRAARFGGGRPGGGRPGAGGRPGEGGRPGAGGRPGQGGRPGAGGRPGGEGGRAEGGRPGAGGRPGEGGRAEGGRPGAGGQGGRQRGRPEISEEDLAKFRKEREEAEKKTREQLAEILLPHQMDRLQELAVQVAGLSAIEFPRVAEQLKVSEAQKKKMDEVRQAGQEEMRTKMREIFTGGGGDREQMFAKITELRTAAEKKVMAELTADQKKKLEELKGKPFEISARDLFSGRQFGGQGGRGGRPGQGGRPGAGGRPGGGRPGAGGRPGGDGAPRPARPDNN